MVKLLIGLNYKEFQVLVWKSKGYPRNSSKDLMDARSRQLEDYLIIRNICKMNAWVHLRFSYLFIHL